MSLIFACCFIYNYFSKYRYFRILEIKTSQIIEGTKHAQIFMTYRIKLMTKRTADQLIFDEIWIEDRLYKIKITDEENQLAENQFRKKQILYIDVESEIRLPSVTPPSEKSGFRIFLGYRVYNKRKYCPIGNIAEEIPQLSVA